MSKFAHLAALGVKLEPRPYTFTEIGPDFTILVLPATEDNTKYQNGFLKQVKKRPTKGRSKVDISQADLDEGREKDKRLLADTCIVGFEKGVTDGEGNSVKFSSDEAFELLQQLPHYMFDSFNSWARNAANFAGDLESREGDEEVGNS